jgi:hypothetical protein
VRFASADETLGRRAVVYFASGQKDGEFVAFFRTNHEPPGRYPNRTSSSTAGGEYDRPVSVFGQFNNADVNAVAQELDRHLQAVLQKAAA